MLIVTTVLKRKKVLAIDAPAAAIEGFLKSVGCAWEHCEQRETSKGTFLFAVTRIPGGPTIAMLPNIVRQALYTMAWPQSMRWGHTHKGWIRPLRSGICQFDSQTVPFSVNFGADDHQNQAVINFGDMTVGHRFLHPKPLTVQGFADYQQKLLTAHVQIDHDERRLSIQQQIQDLAAAHNLTIVDDPALLDEVTGLVEWPVALLGRIDPQFMDLPPAVLQTSMRVHQRYFAVNDDQGRMAPYFIVISNMTTSDQGQQIIIGNERVLRARLSDAQFFYQNDLKVPLVTMAAALNKITFHRSLGTMADKTQRLQALTGYLAQMLTTIDGEQAPIAALLLKADLTSQMVGEFPELQGIMGQAYAHAQGLSSSVAQAIAEHYQPKFAQDSCPTSSLGLACALADRIDTLTGFFGINIKPTGSKDPFALRRAALGLIRLVENDYNIILRDVFDKAYDLYQPWFQACAETVNRHEFLNALEIFFLERIKILWRDHGLDHDIITAVCIQGLSVPMHRMKKKAIALQHFLQPSHENSAGHNLLQAYRRAANILRLEQDKDGCHYNQEPDRTMAHEPAEQALLSMFDNSYGSLHQALEHDDFTTVMTILAAYRPVIDRYFTDIIVNSPDINLRRNRLQTLSHFTAMLHNVADFSQISDR